MVSIKIDHEVASITEANTYLDFVASQVRNGIASGEGFDVVDDSAEQVEVATDEALDADEEVEVVEDTVEDTSTEDDATDDDSAETIQGDENAIAGEVE